MSKYKSLLCAVIAAVTLFVCVGCAGANQTNEPKKEEPLKEPTSGFYTLLEAFENRYISQEHLKDIAYYYYFGKNFGADYMDKDYVPNASLPEALDKDTEEAIKANYWGIYLKDRYNGAYTVDDVDISKYYGTYNNCFAMHIYYEEEMAVFPEGDFEYVGGVYFFTRSAVELFYGLGKYCGAFAGTVTILHNGFARAS